MPDQPEYLDLLNDIRLQEHRAGVYLKAWADKTGHPGLKACLSVVAERETSHGDIFDRRIRELGASPRTGTTPCLTSGCAWPVRT